MPVPLCSHALEILQKRRESTTDPWVFPNTKGTSPMYEPRRAWRHFRSLVGIPDVTIHDLRRTLGSWLAITGASLPVIARALGHKLEQHSVTGVYARLNDPPVREAIEKAVRAMLFAGGAIEGGSTDSQVKIGGMKHTPRKRDGKPQHLLSANKRRQLEHRTTVC